MSLCCVAVDLEVFGAVINQAEVPVLFSARTLLVL
jgi:hypothetical protein